MEVTEREIQGYPLSVLSCIIPVFNEEANLRLLHRELSDSLAALHQAAEILFIDDTSTDATPEIIRALQSTDPRVRGFRLARNSDKGGALAVGFREARGDIVITMDGDLQNDPADLPRLLHALENGADLALGRREQRADSMGKRAASFLFNGCMSLLFRRRLHDANTGFKALRRETVLSVPLTRGLFRLFPFILAQRGLTIVEVPVHHRPRANGRSRFKTGRRLLSLLRLPQALRAAQKPLQNPEELPAYIEM